MRNIAGIDIGNSRIKILFDNQFIAVDNNSNYLSFFDNFFKELGEFPKYVGISSVNKVVFENLYQFFLPHCKVFSQEQLMKYQNVINFKKVPGIGSDRIFGMIGALNYSKPPFITIDCGTAITINFVNKQYICLGGVIYSGPQTQSKALAKFTDVLFETNLIANDKILAPNTEMALNNGIVYSSALSIISITNEIIRQNNLKECNIIVTGGNYSYLKFIFEKYNFKHKFIEHLILDGIIGIINNIVLSTND